MKVKYYLVTLFIVIIYISCGVTDNEKIINIEPGKRDYVWTKDSIDYGNLPGRIEMYSMWGSSPTDVWGASFSAPDLRNSFWHYDGVKWSRAIWDTPISIPGNGSIIIGGVWGTSKNNVWGFGMRQYSNPDRYEAFVMKYDGSTWTEVTGDKDNMPVGFYDICAVNENNFWISAYYNIYHYNNGIWKRYSIGNLGAQAITVIGDNVYIAAYEGGSNTLYMMKKINDKFIAIDSTSLFDGKFGTRGLDQIDNKLYSYGLHGIFSTTITNNTINKAEWGQVISVNNGGLYSSYVISSKDVWVVGWNPNAFHFNGTDWQPITIDNNRTGQSSGLEGIWGDGKEIFICDTEKGIVYHGR